jgi:hypothetical protein
MDNRKIKQELTRTDDTKAYQGSGDECFPNFLHTHEFSAFNILQTLLLTA